MIELLVASFLVLFFVSTNLVSYNVNAFAIDHHSHNKLTSKISYCVPATCEKIKENFDELVIQSATPNLILSLDRCEPNSMRTINIPALPHNTSESYETSLLAMVSILQNYRRSICPFEHEMIEKAYEGLINDYSTFSRSGGHIGYDAYDLLAAALMSPNVLRRSYGLYLEFGVAQGYSINVTSYGMNNIRKLSDIVQIHGFDSFEGLPSAWEGFQRGAFTNNGVLPPVLDGVQLHKGWFEEILPVVLKSITGGKGGTNIDHQERNSSILGVNIDNDLYDGAYYILRTIAPYFTKGTMIHFHEILSKVIPSDELRALVMTMQEVPMHLHLIPVQNGWKEATVFIVQQIHSRH